MTVTIQNGQTATISLKFTNPNGTIASPPSPLSGAFVYTEAALHIGNATLGSDQMTVTYVANGYEFGNDTITYNGPESLTASETVAVVATTANAVVFNESTFTIIS